MQLLVELCNISFLFKTVLFKRSTTMPTPPHPVTLTAAASGGGLLGALSQLALRHFSEPLEVQTPAALLPVAPEATLVCHCEPIVCEPFVCEPSRAVVFLLKTLSRWLSTSLEGLLVLRH